MIVPKPEVMYRAFWEAMADRTLFNIGPLAIEPVDWPISNKGVRVNSKGELMKEGKTRIFETGATRDTDEGKPDYEGYLSPLVIERFGQYMLKHQTDSVDEQRASDNWQKGIPRDQYMKSAWRHFIDMWLGHRLGEGGAEHHVEAMCALLFNVMGYLHEALREPVAVVPTVFNGIQQGADVHIKHETGEIQIDLTDMPSYFKLPNGVRYTQDM